MQKKKVPRKILSILLASAMVIGMITVPGTTVSAEESELGTPDSILNMDEQVPSGLANAKNPYGYDEDIAFPLSVGNEIIYLGGWNGKTEKTTLNGSSIDSLKGYIKGPNKNGSSYNFDMPSGGPWNWIQAVAFDNDSENAKDDKVLFVGVNEDKDAYAWVLDCANSNKISSPLKLGDMDWLSDDYEQFTSTSLFDVVAGDFDGDGVDTLLVYAPIDLNKSNSTGCVLYELSYNGSTLSNKNSANHLLMDQYINDQSKKIYTDESDTKDTRRDKLAVSMQVGDFNGDNIDDLAVLSYSHYRYHDGNTNYYSPQLKICYGNSDLKSFKDRKVDQTFTAAATSGSTLTFPVAASLAAGDYNGDGYDDLYVVGVKATATTGENISKISVSGDKWYLHRFNGTLNSSMSNANYTLIDSNNWFEDGFYADDYCYGKTMAVGVAISGTVAPEMLFIAGSLYDVSTGVPVHKMTGSYFNSADDGATSGWESGSITNTFVQSVIVGNFDNNQAGREQVAFIIGLKQKGHDDYYFKAGFVCGTDFADSTYSDNSPCYGAATSYYCTNLDGEADYIHSDKGDDLEEGLNCMLISVNYDGDDTVEAKYRGVGYIYSDPVVIAVLQAAPYFGDITSLVTSETVYTVETNYSESSSDSNDANLSAGVSATLSVPFSLSISGGFGLKGGVSQSYTDTYTTSYSTTFKAVNHNLVIVNRTPILIYKFDLKENGNWTNTTRMEYCVPDVPTYTSLSVDDYNAFAQSYNNRMTEKEIEDYTPLQTIDKTANWLNENEGNPYAYNQNGWSDQTINATQISKSNITLDYNAGGTGISLTEGVSSDNSFSWSIGFYGKASLAYGTNGNNIGGEIEGDYAHSFGSSTVTGTSATSSFFVQDIDSTELLAKGVPEETIKQYKFTWTCGMWERDLGNKDEDGKAVKTPFLGYALTNLSSPPMAVTDLKVTEQSTTTADSPKLTLSWSKPDSPEGWPSIDKYILYQRVTESDGSISYYPLSEEISSNVTSISINQTVDGNPLEYDTEYTYMIRSAHNSTDQTTYSAYSNTVTVKTPSRPRHTVVFDYDSNAVTVNAVKQGGTTVNNGDQVIEGSILKITGKAQEGYTLVNLTITNATTKETTTVEPAEDGTITCYRRINDKLEFKFNTKKIINEAEVSYTDTVYDETDPEKVIGHVRATISDFEFASGGFATEPVTFTATPEEGYTLTGWNVIVDGTPHYYATNDKTEFTLGLVGETISVTAMFDKTDNIRKTVTIEQPSEGGTIALYNADGIELIPDESGTCTVTYDSQITVVALPATGYVIDSWSGDAVGQTEDRFTLNVIDDITIGIKYRAPIKYKLTYTAEDENMNLVSTEPEITSGSTVAANTQVTLHAKAADGYRIEKWTITQGTETKEYILDDACYLSDSKEITMTANTNVEVSFTKIEKHSITFKQTGKGTISMIHGTNALNSGDKVHHMSNIALFVKPDDGWKLSDLTDWETAENGFFVKYLKNINEAQNINVVFEEIPTNDKEDPDKDDSNKDDSGNTDNQPTQPGDENKPSSDGNNNNNSSDSGNNNSQNNNNQNNSGNNSTSDKNNNGSDQKKPSNTSTSDSKTTAKTGDTFSFLPVIGLFAAAVIICILLKKKKK